MIRNAFREDGSWALVILLILFVAAASLYNLSTPLYESPDELQHAAYAAWLADGRGLPVVDPAAPGPWRQEGTQPPLYYWIVAQVVAAAPLDRVGGLATLNPYAGIGDPQRPDNKNRVLHDMEQERWPFSADAWSVHLARGISTLMAVGTLAAIYCLGRIVFPGRRGIALAMVALVVFIPQFLFLSASINNDNLVILISSWVLVLLAAWIRSEHLPGWPSLLALGTLLGLGVLAKFSGLLLWPLAAGTLLWLAWRPAAEETNLRPGLRWLALAVLLAFGVALLICGWWWLRNQQLYGDLSGLSAHLQIMGPRRRLPSRPRAILAEFKGFRYSFWALFGWFNILVPEPFYWIMDGLVVLGLAGFVLFLARSLRRLPRWTGAAIVMLAAWSGLVAVGVLRWTTLTPASQGRLLYPALGAIALSLVTGWAEWVPRRLSLPVGVAALLAWGACAVLCATHVIVPAYALPERVGSLDELASAPSELHVRYGDCCELVGYVSPDEAVHPGERVPLRLVWRALQPVDHDYSLFVHALTADGQLVGQLDTYHGGGMYPTGQWRAGEIIDDVAYVPISLKAEGPALVHFRVGLHEGTGPARLPAFAEDGQEVDVIFAGESALVPHQWPRPAAHVESDVLFAQQIRLAGISVAQEGARPGEAVTVTLQWEAMADIAQDYTGFVHLVAPDGGDVAQDDHPPRGGRFPTRLWSAGMIVSDMYRLELPQDLEPGTYNLWAGFYRPESGQRLPAVSQQTGDRWKDDLVLVGTVLIASDGR
jgi:4-amino-4-deoxy-L-arabinose transferase-like glycosyltransferase